MIVVAAYDISDDGRRSKVASVLQSMGDRVQRSVFLIETAPEDIAQVRARLAGLMDLDVDSLYLFKQCGHCWAGLDVVGQAERPERVLHWAVF